MSSPLDDLLAQFEPAVAKAFRDAIQAIRDSAILRVVTERLERRDINGAIAALQIEPEAFAALDLSVTEAFNAGGAAAVGDLPALKDADGNRVIFRFGVRNTAGEAWLQQHSSQFVTLVTDDTKQGLRNILEARLAQGSNPRTTALDMVGRINPVTQRREGGILGLTSRQMQTVERARENLLSGDEAALKQYLALETRDKRFDRTILAAIRYGKPIPADMVQKIIGRLSDNNLRLRAEMVSRTETMMALSTARNEAIRQQISAGKIQAGDVKKIWHTAGDNRVRHTHRALNGKAVGIDEAFVSPSGARLRYPADPKAPVAEISGCRCYCQYKVDYFASVERRFLARAV